MRVAGRQVAHLQDLGGQPHHRLHRVRLALVRAAAVQRDAGPHEIEVVGGAEEQAARVGEAGRRRRQLGAQRLEALALQGVDRAVRRVGAGEVAHHQREVDCLQQRRLGGQLVDLVVRHAEPVDAGVDVDGGRQAPSARAAVGRPVAHLGDAAEHRAQVEAGIVRLGAGQQAVENIDGGARLHLARDAAFVERGDEEGLAAFVGERLGDRPEPEAVGVRLDDAGALGAARGLVEARPVGAQAR